MAFFALRMSISDERAKVTALIGARLVHSGENDFSHGGDGYIESFRDFHI